MPCCESKNGRDVVSKVILDANVWIKGLLNVDPSCAEIINAVRTGKLEPVISSYAAAEVVAVLRRIGQKFERAPEALERDWWAIINLTNVAKDFEEDITSSLLREIRLSSEICLLADILKIEAKDVPYIVLARKYNAPLITDDKRSLIDVRERIQELANVSVRSAAEEEKRINDLAT